VAHSFSIENLRPKANRSERYQELEKDHFIVHTNLSVVRGSCGLECLCEEVQLDVCLLARFFFAQCLFRGRW
jgi:hypothetical protein